MSPRPPTSCDGGRPGPDGMVAGIWLFHCHIDWHMISGLAAVMVEAPLELQASQEMPTDHGDVCRAGGTPTAGNAAGNTVELLNLDGQNKSSAPLPAGFTARGIIALVFSVVAAFLGMAVIAWYVLPLPRLFAVRFPTGVRRSTPEHDADGHVAQVWRRAAELPGDVEGWRLHVARRRAADVHFDVELWRACHGDMSDEGYGGRTLLAVARTVPMFL